MRINSVNRRTLIVTLLTLTMACGSLFAQTNAPVPASAPSAVDSLDLLKVVDTDLAALSPPELQQIVLRIDRQVKSEGLAIAELKKQLVKLQMDARRNNPDVKAIDAKILELRKEIQKVIDTVPEILEKTETVGQTTQKMIQLSKTKMKVLTFIHTLGATNAPSATPQGN